MLKIKQLFTSFSFFFLVLLQFYLNPSKANASEIYFGYSDYFPSFRDLTNNLCDLNCIDCQNDICNSCSSGYILIENSCLKCPSSCFECFSNENSWRNNFYCASLSKSYYLLNSNFYECAEGCLKCISSKECLRCFNNSFYLNYNSPSNYSCESCSIKIAGCNTCIYGNYSSTLAYKDFNIIQSNSVFNSKKINYGWKFFCINCENSYALSYDYLCYSCGDVMNCINCAFRDENGLDVGVIMKALRLPKLFTSEETSLIKLRCLSCSIGYIPDIEQKFTFCNSCSNIIPNCNLCSYSTSLNNSGSFLETNWDFISPNFQTHLEIKCVSCLDYFGLDKQYSCGSCPLNCEYCYLNSSTLFCGRCKIDFVLQIYEGVCESISSFSNIPDEYKISCSHIISENPWQSLITNSSNFLCQKCNDLNTFPSITGLCLKCLSSYCSQCYEIGSVNYTNILINSPLRLMNYLTNATLLTNIQKCQACSNSNFGYDSGSQKCCPFQQDLNFNSQNITIINHCESCNNSCYQLTGYSYCASCKTCSNLDPLLLNNDIYIQTVNYQSEYYAKKIYYILKTQASTFSTTPVLNDTSTYTEIYINLNSQQRIDLASENIYSCTPCMITATDCITPDYFSYTSIQSSFTSDDSNQLAYQLSNFNCINGFVYDANLKRCKFCPKNWNSCEAYKKFYFKFEESGSSYLNDIYSFSSLKSLITKLQLLENNGSYSYILNEFAVKSLEIYIEFDPNKEILLKDDDFQAEIYSTLLNKVKSLNNYSIIFQPLGYETDTTLVVEVFWGLSLSFYGFTHVIFRNIKFRIIPYYLTSQLNSSYPSDYDNYKNLFPGIYSKCQHLIINNCDFLSSSNSKYALLYPNLITIGDQEFYSIYGPIDLFCVLTENGLSVYLNNITVSVSIVIPQSIIENFLLFKMSLNFFNLGADSVNIFNIQIIQSQISALNFIKLSLENCAFKIEQSVIKYSSFFNSVLFFSIARNLQLFINELIMKNSTLEKSQLIKLKESIICYFTNISFENSIFLGNIRDINKTEDDYNLVSVQTLYCQNVSFHLCSFSFYHFITFSSNTVLSEGNFQFSFSDIYLANCNFFEAKSNTLLFSIILSSNLDVSNIITFRNIIFNENSFSPKEKITSSHYLFSFNKVYLVLLSNISIIDCQNISGISLDDTEMIEIIYLNFTNSYKNSIYAQFPLSLDEFFSSKISYSVFENIYSDYGIIFLGNTIWTNSKVAGVLFLDSISISNVKLNAIEVQQISCLTIESLLTLNITVVNSNFSNIDVYDSSLYQLSPAVFLIDSIKSSLTIDLTQFANISSTSTRNGCYLIMSQIIIQNSSFSYGNFYNANFLNIRNLGGFLNIQTINLTVISTKFAYSFAFYGGTIYLKTVKTSYVSINDCVFYQSYAINGGIFYIITDQSSETSIDFSHNTINKACAFDTGGLFYMTNSVSSPTTLFLKETIISNINSKNGGILYASYLILTLNTVKIIDNFNIIGDEAFDIVNTTDFINYDVGAMFVLSSSYISFSYCKFSNLFGSNKNSLILENSAGVFTDNYSEYLNIFFSKSCFSFDSSSIFLIGSIYFNISATTESLKSETKYPVIYLSSNTYLNASYIKASNINCSQCNSGGGFIYSISSSFDISNSLFLLIVGSNGGVLYSYDNKILNNFRSNSTIKNCTFNLSRSMKNGGVLFIDSSNINIIDSQFHYNNADLGNGGAIYFKCVDTISSLNISNSIFHNNSAFIGGAIFYQDVMISIISTIFLDNYAPYYGISKFSYPRKLRIIENKSNSTSNISNTSYFDDNNYSISNFRSGGLLPYIYFEILDEEDTPVVPLNNQSIQIKVEILLKKNGTNVSQTNSEIFSIGGNKEKTGIILNNSGILAINPIIIIAPPPSEIYLKITSTSIYLPDSSGVLRNSIYNFTFPIGIRDCIIGELKKDKSTGECFPCQNGMFSYNTSDTECQKCLKGLSCANESGVTRVEASFWRRDNFSMIILPCDNYETNCIGGFSSHNSLCYEGHIGAKCEACDLTGKFWGKSYARSGTYQCVECSGISYNYFILFVISVFSFVSMIVSVKAAVEIITIKLKMRLINKIARYSMIKINENNSSIYIKIYLSYIQIVQVLTQLNLPISQTIKEIPQTIGNPTASALYSIDCFIALFNSKIPYIYIKLIISLIIPFIYLFLFIVGYIIYTYKKIITRKYTYLYTVCLFTLIYFQPSVIQALIRVLACISIGDQSYIKGDVSYFCNSYDYYFYSFTIGIPSLLIWSLITPGVILCQLIANRKDLDELKFQVRYGYLYNEYQIFFWEFVKMYEKILIMIFLEFYETEIEIKGLLILLTLAIYYSLLMRFKPFKKVYFTNVDKLTTMVCFLTIFFGLLTYNNGFVYLVIISYIIIIGINIGYNIFILDKIISSYTSTFDLIKKKIIEFLRKIKFLKKWFTENNNGYHTLDKWRKVRRATAKYLREKEKRKEKNTIKDEKLKYALSIQDYDANFNEKNSDTFKKDNETEEEIITEKKLITEKKIMFTDVEEEKTVLECESKKKFSLEMEIEPMIASIKKNNLKSEEANEKILSEENFKQKD